MVIIVLDEVVAGGVFSRVLLSRVLVGIITWQSSSWNKYLME